MASRKKVTHGRKSKRVQKIRQASEFDVMRLLAGLRQPTTPASAFAWQLSDIRSARDDQMRGVFKMPARLAEAMRTDDALFTAYDNRLDPIRNLALELAPPNTSSAAKKIASEAEALFGNEGVGLRKNTEAQMNGDLANHGVAFGYCTLVPRDDGSRIDVDVRYWPIEFVRWDSINRCFMTQIDLMDPDFRESAYRENAAHPLRYKVGFEVPIVHGDGRWIIAAKAEHEPWKQEACLMPGSLLWGARGFGLRDWGKNSQAHGNAKMFGELPEGVPLQIANGELSAEALAFLQLLQDVMSGFSLVGLRPSGAKTEFVANSSTNWQVFKELIENRDRAAARIYLGTDGTLGSPGGAPGVDVKALFGVATTKVQGDLQALARAYRTGVLEPWAALNFGDSSLAPSRKYMMPDADEEAERENLAKRLTSFHDELDRRRRGGFEVTQDVVADLAKRFDVPAPTLKVISTPAGEQPKPAPASPPTNGGNGKPIAPAAPPT